MEYIKSIITNIDATIFISFLALNLIFGLMASKGVSTIRSYSIGNKDFSTATIASTIIATLISGALIFSVIAQSYIQGLGFILVNILGSFLNLLIMGKFFAPRMGEFLNKLSIAEAMGDLYGKNVRIITAISGFVSISGIIAIQLKISGLLFQYALGVPLVYGVIISGIIITLYSSLGGIKSVTFTDVIQLMSFGTIIPVIAYFLFQGIGNENSIIDTLNNNPLFDFNKIFTFANPNLYYLIYIFIWLIIPGFNPAIFQRVAMSKNIKQVKYSFIISAVSCFLLASIASWIGILILTIYPKLNGDEIVKVMISEYNWITGFKGVILAGAMAMVMSTVDSYINSSSILLVHDLRQSLGKNLLIDELKTTKLCSMVIGSIAILFAIRSGSFLDLIISASMFYMPIVTVPFIMAIFGFRSSSKSVILGMIAGFSVALLWELYINIARVGGVIPGMLANLFVLMTSHYLLKQEGGWIKRDKIFEENITPEQLSQKKKFNLAIYLKKSFPKNEAIVPMLGIFMIVSNFLTANAIPTDAYSNHEYIFDSIYIITLFISTILVSYSLWPAHWKTTNYIPIIWHAVIFIIPVCFSCLAVIMSNFSEMQLMLFMSNMIIISALLHWKTTLLFIATGIITVLFFVKEKFGTTQLQTEIYIVKYKFAYLLFMVSSVLFMFLKPKQEQIEETEAKVGGLEEEVDNLGNVVGSLNSKITDLSDAVVHYSERVQDQQQEIERLGATAQKILNNVNHELRLPVGNVINFAEMLSEGLEKYSKEQLKVLCDEVFTNSNRLSTMILNMLDLATLDVKKIELQKQTINLSELVSDRVKSCRKIYLQDKQIDFEIAIEPEILISLDPNYIKQTIDNLIINAITYSNSGVIKISVLRTDKNQVEIIVKDEGIGIPKAELYDIFTPFKMGTHTESKAQGRGVGLALCKSAVEAHGGTITVESNGKGALFRILLIG